MRRVTRITRSVNLGDFQQNPGAAVFVGRGLFFTLSDLPSVAEFTSLFEQYKFEKVVVHMIPFANWTVMDQHATVPLVTAIDFDDGTDPTSEDQLLQYGNNCITHATQEIHRTIQPKIAAAVYNAGGIFNGYAIKTSWISSDSPNVQHYGFKMGIRPSPPGTHWGAGWLIYADYHIAFRNTR